MAVARSDEGPLPKPNRAELAARAASHVVGALPGHPHALRCPNVRPRLDVPPRTAPAPGGIARSAPSPPSSYALAAMTDATPPPGPTREPAEPTGPAAGPHPAGDLGLVLSGGGALAAYQVGVLRHLGRRWPELHVPVLTGVSAGAINAAALASFAGDLDARTEQLVAAWERLTAERVFRVGRGDLAIRTARWGLRLVSGGLPSPRPRSLLDTRPLRGFLIETFAKPDGSLPGVAANLAHAWPRALAISASRYSTGQSVTWVQGTGFVPWRRAHRVSRVTQLRLEHGMASASLPLLFPSVRADGDWYGDGGILQTAPLSPAIHLGASRILAITTRFQPADACALPGGDDDGWRSDAQLAAEQAAEDAAEQEAQEGGEGDAHGYPPPARIAGTLLNALFLDQFDSDALNVRRINRLIARLPAPARGAMRPIRMAVLRPSCELSKLANRYEARLPRAVRFLTRGLGTRKSQRNELLSLLMFQPDYVHELIALGESDTAAREHDIAALLRAPQAQESESLARDQ